MSCASTFWHAQRSVCSAKSISVLCPNLTKLGGLQSEGLTHQACQRIRCVYCTQRHNGKTSNNGNYSSHILAASYSTSWLWGRVRGDSSPLIRTKPGQGANHNDLLSCHEDTSTVSNSTNADGREHTTTPWTLSSGCNGPKETLCIWLYTEQTSVCDNLRRQPTLSSDLHSYFLTIKVTAVDLGDTTKT